MYVPNAASGYEWNRMATLSIRFYSLHLRCIVHCINSSYSEYSLLKKASEPLARRSQTSINNFLKRMQSYVILPKYSNNNTHITPIDDFW